MGLGDKEQKSITNIFRLATYGTVVLVLQMAGS